MERARRYWAVYEGDTLLCLTVYKKGARSVIERLRELSGSVRQDVGKEIIHERICRVAVS
jgi:hypothetical protein